MLAATVSAMLCPTVSAGARAAAQRAQFGEQPLFGVLRLGFQGDGIVHDIGPPAGPHPIRILSAISDAGTLKAGGQIAPGPTLS
jgi:hypothetical protein